MNEDLEQFGFRKGFDWENRFDLKTKIDKYTISTVDLGIDHNFFGEIPLYYETMIFNWEDESGNPFDYYQFRYPTEKMAKEGHEEAIGVVKRYLEVLELEGSEK